MSVFLPKFGRAHKKGEKMSTKADRDRPNDDKYWNKYPKKDPHRESDSKKSSHRDNDSKKPPHRDSDSKKPPHRDSDSKKPPHRDSDSKKPPHRDSDSKKPPHRDTDPKKPSEDTQMKPRESRKSSDMLTSRTGGAYIPPAKLRLMQENITDKSSPAYQRIAWEALKKSIHGCINKINTSNIGVIAVEILHENIVRGRGLLCKSIIQAQAASPTFTNVYAALVAVINSKFPNIGELLLKRLILQFKRAYKQNNKTVCISAGMFIAHLVNQRVAHEILALEILTLLVETPTDDSVEVAIAFLKECGQRLTEVSSRGINAIFEMLRNILHEGKLEKRIQYMIEVVYQIRKDGFKDHAAIVQELDLVNEEEQLTHLVTLEDVKQADSNDILNVFKFDDNYEENEGKYKTLSKEILGSDESGSEGSGSEEDDDDEDEDNEEEEAKSQEIIDKTETSLTILRRTIYLTIQSSLDFEECAHKLMKMQLKPGQEVELCHMFLDCCAEQRTYEKFYGLLAERFCRINKMYVEPFQQIFKNTFLTTHRLDTNRIRNVAKFCAHLLFTDAISWEVLEVMKLNEEDSNSSNRVFIKILFQELSEYMGLVKLNERLKDPTLQPFFEGLFPRDNPKNTRFAINFFTLIGLGGLTDELREHLKSIPKPAQVPIPVSSSSSGSSSSEESSSSSDSSSESDNEKHRKKRKLKKDDSKSKKDGDGKGKEKAKDELQRKDRGRKDEDKERAQKYQSPEVKKNKDRRKHDDKDSKKSSKGEDREYRKGKQRKDDYNNYSQNEQKKNMNKYDSYDESSKSEKKSRHDENDEKRSKDRGQRDKDYEWIRSRYEDNISELKNKKRAYDEYTRDSREKNREHKKHKREKS